MAGDTTLGRFVFEFISNTDSLKKGNAEAAASSEDLAKQIERISLSNDNLSRRMVSASQTMMRAAQASEWLASKQNRAAESNEGLTTAITTLTEDLTALTDAQAREREEADKSDKQIDKQGRTLEGFTKRLLALGAAYFSVNKVAGGFKTSFTENLELAKFTELLDLNAASVKNWTNILEGAGGDAGDIFETFKNISIQLGEIDVAGTGAPLLQAVNRLGIKIKDEFGKNLAPDEILLSFADALQNKNLDKELSLFVAGQFGISDDVLRLLNRGRADIEALLKEQREEQVQITPEDTAAILGFEKQLEDVKQQAASLFTEIGLENLKSAQAILESIESVIKSIRGGNFTEDFIETAPGAAGEAFSDFQMWINGMIENNRAKIIQDADAARLRSQEPQLDEATIRFMTSQAALNPINTFNTGGAGGSVSFGDITINTSGGNGEQIASEFITQLNKQFTAASEVLGNSVIA